jgi:hypothetical protein
VLPKEHGQFSNEQVMLNVDEDYKLLIIPREKKQNAGRSEHEIMLNVDKDRKSLLSRTGKQNETTENRGGHIMLNVDEDCKVFPYGKAQR